LGGRVFAVLNRFGSLASFRVCLFPSEYATVIIEQVMIIMPVIE